MSASYSVEDKRVIVKVTGSLDYEIRHVFRTAREAARVEAMPLKIDVQQCLNGNLGGIWEILIAERDLSSVELCGCHDAFVDCFNMYGICEKCSRKASCTDLTPARRRVRLTGG